MDTDIALLEGLDRRRHFEKGGQDVLDVDVRVSSALCRSKSAVQAKFYFR
jgi:hypothetical protein